jgi:hypothetical protein
LSGRSRQREQGLRLRARLRALYHGASPAAVRFRYGIIVIDLAIIAFFIAAPLMRQPRLTFYLIDYAWRRSWAWTWRPAPSPTATSRAG